MVYTSQAYDCIYDWLSKEDRDYLEKNLFKPFADFISIGNPQFFNRIHNHSTWGTAAVGMIALVMDDDSLLNRALYGIKKDNIYPNAKDNDGGYIKSKDGKAGFIANLEESFSPDGYFTEGPYYQRYAMYPFLIFAEALQNKKPELNIFEFKDSVLIKSVNALINLTDEDGDFFPLNDAQKGMSYYSRELVTAVDITYQYGGNNPELLSIAKKQDKVVLDDSGLSVALGIQEGKEKPFAKSSINLTDGPNGDQGGVAILRKNDLELVFKYTGQGSSHGHYDKLSFSLYEEGDEVIQDYGLARFVNIEQKGGGNYLKENTTWAKQTIAHNTLVQNETSDFNGKFEIGSKYHSKGYIFNTDNSDLQVVSAKENNAYSGTELQRTMVLVKDSILTKPYVLDIMKVTSNKPNQYDLPFYYLGQFMQTNVDYSTPKTLAPLGKDNGYQHLYKEGLGVVKEENIQFNWLLNDRFYTITSIAAKGDELILTRIGANDPEFNLRRDPGIIIRKKNAKDALFVSVIESHGSYSPVSEFAVNAYSNIKKLKVLYDNASYSAIEIMTNNNDSIFILANNDSDKSKTHQLNINGKEFQWKGPFTFQNLNR